MRKSQVLIALSPPIRILHENASFEKTLFIAPIENP
ncbi:hypothetical protein EMIT013CA1_20323 [Bacillus sp. IT-13CA1]